MPTRADLDVRISLPPNFDFGWVLGFLAARTVTALESVAEGAYRRSVRLEGKPVTFVLTDVRANPCTARAPPGASPASATPTLASARRLCHLR